MIEWIEGLHPLWAIAFFWLVGAVRTSAVFLMGWIAAAGSQHMQKIQSAMHTPIYRKAQSFVNRWGVLAVPLCFLTVGFQTAVIITTGFTHMPLRRWIPAMLLGTLMWACIYSTIGMAVIWAWIEQPWVVAPVLVLGILIFSAFYIRKKNRMKKL